MRPLDPLSRVFAVFDFSGKSNTRKLSHNLCLRPDFASVV